MPRYEIRRQIEEVITVEADNSEDALAVAQETDEAWETVGDEHVSTAELVRCCTCGQEVEQGVATRLPDGCWQGNLNQCGCDV